MKSNVGKSDRIIRIVLALIIVFLFYKNIVTGILGYVLLAFGAILILTSLISFCPIYKLFGINSCAIKKNISKSSYLFAITFLISILSIEAQVNAGQIDDFENGTTSNWTDGGSSAQPINISSGGPNGASDNYLSDPALGGNGPGSRMVMFNDQQWAGNYSSVGIVAIGFDVRVLTNDLDLRVAFDGNGGRICTINAVTVTANGPWHYIEIPISASDFTTVAGGTSVAQTLSDVTDMRILSNSVPSWQGESIVSTLEIDNIEGLTVLGLDDFENNTTSFKITTNPSSNYLNISLPSNSITNSSLIAYDIYGKPIMDRKLNEIKTSIPISNWNSGIYFIQVSNKNSSQVKKFIKI